jgi:hypothetical protein
MLRSRKLLQSFFTKRNFFRNFFRIVPSEAADDDDLRKNQIRTTEISSKLSKITKTGDLFFLFAFFFIDSYSFALVDLFSSSYHRELFFNFRTP